MDKEKAAILLRTIFAEFKRQGAEILAYQKTFEALKTALSVEYPDFAPLADASLAAARASTALQETLRKQYDEPLEKFLEQVAQSQTEDAVAKLLLAMPVNKFVN